MIRVVEALTKCSVNVAYLISLHKTKYNGIFFFIYLFRTRKSGRKLYISIKRLGTYAAKVDMKTIVHSEHSKLVT